MLTLRVISVPTALNLERAGATLPGSDCLWSRHVCMFGTEDSASELSTLEATFPIKPHSSAFRGR